MTVLARLNNGATFHAWTIYAVNAKAFFSKRSDSSTDDAMWFMGSVFVCRSCRSPHFRFVPSDTRLNSVDVDRVPEFEEESLCA